MTEAEWLGCEDPEKMLEFVQGSGKASDRKLRQFAVACCRLIWHEITDERSRQAVEVAQRFADEKATGNELAIARDAAPPSYRTYLSNGFPYPDELAASAAAECAAESIDTQALLDDIFGYGVFDYVDMKLDCDGYSVAATILRETFGNPFRPISLNPSWLTWNDGTVRRLAEAIYGERSLPEGHLDVARLGVLADALEDAGCDDADILGHLRGPGVHVRGCHVIDLLTGRE
jgi:hypothetical protein